MARVEHKVEQPIAAPSPAFAAIAMTSQRALRGVLGNTSPGKSLTASSRSAAPDIESMVKVGCSDARRGRFASILDEACLLLPNATLFATGEVDVLEFERLACSLAQPSCGRR